MAACLPLPTAAYFPKYVASSHFCEPLLYDKRFEMYPTSTF